MVVFVCDWRCKFLLMFWFVIEKSFGDDFCLPPRSTNTFYVLVNPKVIYQNFVQLLFFRNAAGVIYITNLDHYLANHYITKTGTLPILER
jgi:hypothetical protein